MICIGGWNKNKRTLKQEAVVHAEPMGRTLLLTSQKRESGGDKSVNTQD